MGMQNLAALLGPWKAVFYPVLFLFILLLYVFSPAARKRAGTAAALAAFSAAGALLAALAGAALTPRALHLLTLGNTLLGVLALICAAGALGFSVLLPKTRIRVPKLAEDLMLAGAYLAGGLAALSASGADLSGVLTTSAVATAVLAFALQDTLGNVIGGMVLHIDNTFAPGDWITMDSFEGVVREIRWRQTTLETLDGDIVVIPNINLMKSAVVVQGRAAGGTRFRAVAFNVYYDRTPGEVMAAVNAAFREDPPARVAASPAPYCGLKDFQPGYAVYELRYYLSDLSSPGGTDSAVREKVYYALARAGIKLSVHSRSLVLSDSARDAAERGVRGERERRLAALKGVDVFQTLTEEERGLLADRLAQAPFADGEALTRQGAVADWLYIIGSGRAEVRLFTAGGDYTVVKTLGPGDVLGEMGLLTGEPRTATVTALGETVCYRLDRESFRGVLASRPEIAEGIAAMLARRRVELNAARAQQADAAVALKDEERNLLGRIRKFFDL